MNSTHTMLILLAFYFVIMAQSLLEKNWYRGLYFLGAIIISVAVIGMTEKEAG